MTFAPPGHRQGRGVDPDALAILGKDFFAADILVTGGLDDFDSSGKVLQRAQDLMAEAVRADKAFFSTCGSSLSVKAAMLAVAGPNDKLLISRHAHKSVISALVISGAWPVWVPPRWDAKRHLSHPSGPRQMRPLLEASPDAVGAIVATPTDYGTCADLQAISDLCHEYGKVFIVDEAWGAHFPFHQRLPQWGMDVGADLCVTSVHKMGAAIEQSSVFHLKGDRVDPAVLKARSDILSTTSPSTLVYASLDAWRRQMMMHGKELLERTIARAVGLRERVNQIAGIVAEGEELCGPNSAADIDPLKLVIDLIDLDVSGYEAAKWLRDNKSVEVGLSDHRRVTVQITQGDDEARVDALVEALQALAHNASELPSIPRIDLPEPGELELETAVRPRDAFFGEAEAVDASRAAGRVCAELLTPYPPGVPAVAPGEVLTKAVVDYLRTGLASGMKIPDAADPKLQTIKVMSR